LAIKSIKRRLTKNVRNWFQRSKNSAQGATFHVVQGDAANATKNWPQAIEHYTKALVISPNLTPIWVQLGHGYRETDQFEPAEQSYLRALGIEPDNQDAKFFLDITRAELARRKRAAQPMTPSEEAWEAPEPPEFSFYPRDLPSSWAYPDDDCDEGEQALLRFSGRVLGRHPHEKVRLDSIARTLMAFEAISRPWVHADTSPVEGALEAFVPSPAGSFSQFEQASSKLFGNNTGIELADIWFVNSRLLRLRLEPYRALNAPVHTLRCFQYDPDNLQDLLILADQALSTDVPSFFDVKLASPFLPVCFVVHGCNAEILSLTMLQFPSLCRGGFHFGELLNLAGRKTYLQALQDVGASFLQAALTREGRPAIKRIVVDLDTATGTERIFQKSLQLWLTHALGLSISVGHVPEGTDREVTAYLTGAATCTPVEPVLRPDCAAFLRLSADAIPSLQTLMVDFDKGAGSGAAAFVLASASDGKPKYVLRPPYGRSEADRHFQGTKTFPIIEPGVPADRPQKDAGNRPSGVAAIRFCRFLAPDEAQLVAPLPLGLQGIQKTGITGRIVTSPVSVVHSYSGDEKTLAAILQALALQHGGDELRVLVAGSAADADCILSLLRRFFATRGHFVPCPDDDQEGARLNRAAEQVDTDFLLVIGDTILLHDPCTTSALSSLLSDAAVASASCMLIGPQASGKTTKLDLMSAGYFPSAMPGTEVGQMSLVNGDVLLNLPHGTWPTAANSSRMFMVKSGQWRQLGGFTDQRSQLEELGTLFWTRARAEGSTHLLTTAVSASVLPAAGKTTTDRRTALPLLASDDTTELAVTVKRLVA
jgi:tetratricopeptide (TPR) repeat protein